jgi:soluble lytic murein transglycosylase-like protein
MGLPARIFFVIVIGFNLLLPLEILAGIYVYVDENGVSHFTNAPTSSRYKPMQFNKTHTPRSGSSMRGKVNPAIFDHHIRQAALAHMIDPLLIKAIIMAESSFDPHAVSSAGAQGLMQLMPDTAREMQVGDPFDAAQNIAGGTRYFRYLLNVYEGDLTLSLAAYNAGPSRVSRKGPLPAIAETRNYVQKVLRFYRSYRQNSPVSLSGDINMGQMVTIN